MFAWRSALAVLAAAAWFPPAFAANSTPDTSAFLHILGVLDKAESARFDLGKQLFEQDWAIAPGPHPGFDGLGPLFNRLSCDGCHTRAGRGEPPREPDHPMISMTIKLSVPGTDANGGPKPHPLYGDQLDRNAVAGVPIEGTALASYTGLEGKYVDGTPFSLRVPHYRFENLAFGPLGNDTLVSARVAPALVGLGLIDAVPDEAIKAIAAEEERDGTVHGRANLVWDMASHAMRIGRFGWKAGQPNVRQQNANAFNREIGVTSSLYPENDCTEVETACRTAAAEAPRHPKMTDEFLDATTFFLAHLAPPEPQSPASPDVERGAALFKSVGCVACHRPTLETGTGADARLAHLIIHPYTDLLVHDMGEGLADGRSEFKADGRSWRTAPLWGLGRLRSVNNHEFLLHDGRARGPAEAILWHGGEAEFAKEAFRQMSKTDRDALIAFLEQL
jgi:CxxC motif-containing protein (DUF1111 family)